jgi:hypothetical protein
MNRIGRRTAFAVLLIACGSHLEFARPLRRAASAAPDIRPDFHWDRSAAEGIVNRGSVNRFLCYPLNGRI